MAEWKASGFLPIVSGHPTFFYTTGTSDSRYLYPQAVPEAELTIGHIL